jgi:hypothetical protein
MADREMIAATLAAALIQKADRVALAISDDSAERVVEVYHLVLTALDKAGTSDRPPSSFTSRSF